MPLACQESVAKKLLFCCFGFRVFGVCNVGAVGFRTLGVLGFGTQGDFRVYGLGLAELESIILRLRKDSGA